MIIRDSVGTVYEIDQKDIDRFLEYCREKPTCGFCFRGGYEGGPGFFDFGQCVVYDDVHYGGRIVNPKECKHFVLAKDTELTMLFLSLCKHYPDMYCTGRYLVAD